MEEKEEKKTGVSNDTNYLYRFTHSTLNIQIYKMKIKS